LIWDYSDGMTSLVSSSEEPSLSSQSSSLSLLKASISRVSSLSNFLLFSIIFTWYIAFNTLLPIFSKSPVEKCYPTNLPRLAPANEASSVKTKGIFN